MPTVAAQSALWRELLRAPASLLRSRLRGPFLLWYAIFLGLVNLPAAWEIVRHGGFSADDWWYEALRHYGSAAMNGGRPATHTAGFIETLARFWPTTRDRPVGDFYYAATHAVFGLHMHAYLVLTLLLTLALGLLVYAVMRQLGFSLMQSACLGLLVTLVPYADAARYWALAGQAVLSVDLFVGGALLALIALRSDRPVRRLLPLHALALLLLVLSVLDYQLTIGLVFVAFIMYLAVASPRATLVRWIVDAVVCTGLVAYFRQFSIKPAAPVDINRVKLVYGHGMYVVGAAVYPNWSLSSRVPFLAEVALLLAGLVVVLASASQPWAPELRRWVWLGGGSLVWIVAAWAALLPTVGYDPRTTGAGNRINAAAVVGAVGLAWSVVMIALVLVGVLLRRRRWVQLAAPALALLLAVGYGRVLRRDQYNWTAAFRAQEHALHEITRHVAVPRYSTVFTSGTALDYGGAPVFNAPFELIGAIKLALHDGSAMGIPLAPHNAVDCQGLVVWAQTWGPVPPEGRLGSSYLIDVDTGKVIRLTSAKSCQAANNTLTASDPPPASVFMR